MPKIALCSIAAMDRSLGEAAALAARCGADGLEVTARAPHLDAAADLGTVRAAGDRVRDAGIEVTAYGSYLSGGDDRRLAERVTREVARAEALGTRRLRVWAAHPEGAGDEVREAVVAMLRAAGDAAAERDIEVVVERHGGTLADTAERCERLLDVVGRANVTLNYQVLDGLPSSQAERQADDARRLIPRARYFHVKNYRPSRDGRGPLLPGGDLERGVLDYRAILAAAVAAGYGGPYAIEFVAFDGRPLEDKVAGGVAFLRRVLSEPGAP